METKVINKEKMEALTALATANVKMGEAKGNLAKIISEESEYLEGREKKALERIQKVIDESAEVLNGAFSNYEEIKKFGSDVSDLAKFLEEACADFQDLQNTFKEYTEAWQVNIAATEKKLEEVKKQQKIDQVQIESDKDWVRKEEKKIAVKKRKIRSDRETLDRTISRLKENAS